MFISHLLYLPNFCRQTQAAPVLPNRCLFQLAQLMYMFFSMFCKHVWATIREPWFQSRILLKSLACYTEQQSCPLRCNVLARHHFSFNTSRRTSTSLSQLIIVRHLTVRAWFVHYSEFQEVTKAAHYNV